MYISCRIHFRRARYTYILVHECEVPNAQVLKLKTIFKKRELNVMFRGMNMLNLILQRLEFLASLEMASLGSFPLLAHANRDFNE